MKFDIEGAFPFSSFNPGQREAIEAIVEAYLSGVKHIVVEAPTGVGKSAIAYTVHKVLASLNDWHRTTVITGTKGLQDQYVSEHGDMYDLKGKNNYSCIIGDFSYNSPKCKSAIANNKCSTTNCPYVSRRDHWLNRADLRLTNASFVIKAPAALIASDTTRTKLLIIDECHELPTHLINHATATIDVNDLKTSLSTYGNALSEQLKVVFNLFKKVPISTAFRLCDVDKDGKVGEFYNKAAAVLSGINSRIEKGDTTNVLHVIAEELNTLVGSLSTFVNQVTSEWILTEFKYGSVLEAKPVYAKQVSKAGVFSKANQFVHMSATICGYEAYCKNLGIPLDEAKFISVPNPIPVENRAIKLVGSVNVNKNVDVKLLAKEIDAIIAKHDKMENGVIHTVSFKLAQDIVQASKYKSRMLISNDRKEIMNAMSTPSGTILLSPSVETGYDFKGDLARWQILAKVPYGFIGDPFVKLNMSRDPVWYARQAILRMVQASGRVTRGISDYGVTYIVDSNATRLIIDNDTIFPDWYLDAIDIS